MQFLIQQLENFGNHDNFGCTSKNMIFNHEIRKGFDSTLFFKCSMCNIVEKISSERSESEQTMMPINDAVVIFSFQIF